MMKYILIAFTLLVVSFYFFPFQFRFLPAVNTKMALAALGLVILGIQLARNRNALINKDFFILSIFAAFVSLAGLISVIYNETPDYAYATYIISMWVWISAAYVVVSLIRWVHGTVSVYLLCNYLIALSVAQCILALTMDFSAPVKEFIFSIQDASVGDFFTRKARLSGLGAGLDVAGSRFSAVLIMISILCVNNYQKIKPYLLLYILAFVVIGIIGNMIGRTTTVGMIIAIAYLIVGSAVYMSGKDRNHIWLCISSMLIIAIPILIYDARHRAVAAVHAGWRSTVLRISQKALSAMKDCYGTLAADVRVAIGPGISMEAFEVGDEVYEAFEQARFPMSRIARRYPALCDTGGVGKWHVDLWQANCEALYEAGVSPRQIQLAGICTYRQAERFFSARRLGIRSGRILNGIFLTE